MSADEMKAAIRRHRAGESTWQELQEELKELEGGGVDDQQPAQPDQPPSPPSA